MVLSVLMNKNRVSRSMHLAELGCKHVSARLSSLNVGLGKSRLTLWNFIHAAFLMLSLCLSAPLSAQQTIDELADEGAVSELLAELAETTRVRPVYGQFSKVKIGEVPFNSGFKIVRRESPWVIIQFNQPNVPAWVSKDYVSIRRGVATVEADVLNMRLAPELGSKLLTKLYAGYTSRVLSERNGFVQIKAPTSFAVAIKPDENSKTKFVTPRADVASLDTNGQSVGLSEPASEPIIIQSVGEVELADTAFDQPQELPQASSKQVVSSAKTPAERQHKIAPGDAISLLVFGESDLSIENVRVPQSGRVSFPLIGQVPVAGRTTAEVEQSVAALLSQGYVRNPRLSVTIFSYRPIFIRGAVQNTGAFPYTEGLTISKAIALAGGSKNSAKQQGVSILRDGLTVEENLSVDSQYQVSSGDVISIAEERGVTEDENLYIYVHGEVAQPGEYVYRKGLTVEKAIVLASGFSLRASKGKITITRYAGVEADAEPTKLRRVKLFTPIEPGDVIDVGASWF